MYFDEHYGAAHWSKYAFSKFSHEKGKKRKKKKENETKKSFLGLLTNLVSYCEWVTCVFKKHEKNIF